MTRNKASVFVFTFIAFALLPFAIGCASGGMKKPTVYVDRSNNIPADIPSQFLDRYERFISSKERKEFEKLLTDEERQAFIDKFWLKRDTNPTTPENEEKQKIDRLIDNIANEPFFSTPGTTGLLFRSNGGFRGDLAKVYLLHGEPDAMDTIESVSHSFVSLMLWVYLNPENGNILYAFLFYQKGGLGSFRLFFQDSYQLDPCGAIYDVAIVRPDTPFAGGGRQDCSEELYEVYNEIARSSGKGGIIGGHVFAWALFNFSQDSSVLQGKVLEPPKPASEIAKQSNARVVGEAPKINGVAGVDYILSSCEQCKTFIPAELKLGKVFALTIRRSDVDWRIVGNQAKSVLKVRLVFESVAATQAPLVFERWAIIESLKNLIVSDPVGYRVIPLLTTNEMDQIPVGTYWVSIYVKNVTPGLMTKKYNAWSKKFTK